MSGQATAFRRRAAVAPVAMTSSACRSTSSKTTAATRIEETISEQPSRADRSEADMEAF